MSSFTMTTLQIWSCHVTPATNFGNFYFLHNSTLYCWKNYQIWGKLAQKQKSYRQKNKTRGGKQPPTSAYRVKGTADDRSPKTTK